jgi:hypothetical protein
MGMLARKTNLAAWSALDLEDSNAVPADAIVGQLQTKSNTLSFWRCDPTSTADLTGVALAIASAWKAPDAMHLVCVEESALASVQVRTVDVRADTVVSSMNDRHVDLVQLDGLRLARTGELVKQAIERGSCFTLTASEVVQIIADAVVRNQVELSKLKDKMRTAVVGAMRVDEN